MELASFEPIAKHIQPKGQLQKVWPLNGGMSAEMVALEIAAPDGTSTKFVVRWYDPAKYGEQTPSLAQEQKILKLVRAAGIKAPDSYLIDSSLSLFPREYMVITFIEGQMSFAPQDRLRHVSQLAHQLAQIHQIKARDHQLDFLPLTTHCSELAKVPVTANGALREDEIRQRLSELTWPTAANEAALLHGDFWPGNSLWQNGKLQAVIDWEDARVGDPLSDFAKSRLEIAWIFGQVAANTFTEQYQSAMPLDYSALPFWDLCAMLRMLRLSNNDFKSMASYFHFFGRDDISEQSIVADLNALAGKALKSLN